MKKIPKGAGRIILSFRILKFFILIIHPACASDMVPVEMLPSLLRAVPAKPLRNLKFWSRYTERKFNSLQKLLNDFFRGLPTFISDFGQNVPNFFFENWFFGILTMTRPSYELALLIHDRASQLTHYMSYLWKSIEGVARNFELNLAKITFFSLPAKRLTFLLKITSFHSF